MSTAWSTVAANRRRPWNCLTGRSAVKLSREDAQIRATLGCGRSFAAGTVDRALADAYRPAVCEVLK